MRLSTFHVLNHLVMLSGGVHIQIFYPLSYWVVYCPSFLMIYSSCSFLSLLVCYVLDECFVGILDCEDFLPHLGWPLIFLALCFNECSSLFSYTSIYWIFILYLSVFMSCLRNLWLFQVSKDIPLCFSFLFVLMAILCNRCLEHLKTMVGTWAVGP